MAYKIEMRYAFCWDDAGWTYGIDDEAIPMRFGSRKDAQIALDKFFDEVDEAVARGDMDESKDQHDYRVVKTTE